VNTEYSPSKSRPNFKRGTIRERKHHERDFFFLNVKRGITFSSVKRGISELRIERVQTCASRLLLNTCG
jgi:transposase